MAHGVNAMLKRGANHLGCKNDGKTGVGSRRIFAPQFKLQVLDSYRNDADCKGNQRATARKYGIHRRQIQKWLQVENNLRNSVIKTSSGELIANPEARNCGIELALRNTEHRQLDDVSSEAYSRTQCQIETEAELVRNTALRIGGTTVRDALVDNRVPDIPRQHSPTSATYVEHTHQWCSVHKNNYNLDGREMEFSNDNEVVSTSPPRPLPFVPVRESISPACPVIATSFKCESPEAPLLPLDFTTHSRRAGSFSPSAMSPALLADNHNTTPMDLSLKKTNVLYTNDIATDIQVSAVPVPVPVVPATHVDSKPINTNHPLIWDLSTKTIKRDLNDTYAKPNITSTESVKQPVKLFKPYLDDLDDFPDYNSDVKMMADAPLDHSSNSMTETSYTITMAGIYTESDPYAFSSNNNTVFKVDGSYYKDDHFHLSSANVNYCPINGDYYPNSSIQHYVGHYDDIRNPFIFNKNSNSIKQRQSYSLDFKLSAIECYYSDAVCRGNQRAVASKFKIHRRQVQKWLKQEDQLRQRNETVKPMYIVR